MLYEWLKAFHVISIIAWMAAILYLPRLFVYHVGAEAGGDRSETLKIMERRLLKAIMTPAMIASWVFGLAIIFAYGIGFGDETVWLHIKLLFVVGLSAVHGYLARCVRVFAEDRNERSERFYRILNEVPTLLMIAIVILVIVKPF